MTGAPAIEIAIQAVGWLGSALVIGAFWSTNDRRMAVALALGLAAMSVHFAAIGAATAAANCALGAFRGAASLRWPGSRRLMLGVCAAGVIVSVLTWSGAASALAMAAGTANTIFLLTLGGARLRLSMAAASGVWIAHHLLVGSLPALAMEMLVAAGNLVSAGRLLRTRPSAAA